ncbi:transposase [Streptomyces umbrinus]
MAGKRLTGWIVIDLDATVITSASKKTGAAVTFKKTFGFHPLAAWCANTTESPAMLLRPGNAGANTVADHIRVLTDALAQIPGSSAAKILVRVDGAGATHGLLEHLEALNTTRRTVRYTVGWKITEDEKAVAKLPEAAWETSRTISSIRDPVSVVPSLLTTLSTGVPSRPALRTPAYSVTFNRSLGKVRPSRATRAPIHRS